MPRRGPIQESGKVRDFLVRSGLDDSFADQNLHFDAPVLLAPFAGCIVSDRLGDSEAERHDDAAKWDGMVLGQV